MQVIGLTETQEDLLKEYVNVFIGKAANMLSEMANQRILLSVPEVKLVNMAEDAASDSVLTAHGHVVSSSMRFGKSFSGRALLIFPSKKAKVLVDACMGMPYAGDDENDPQDLADTDFDVLKEISNVILNSVVGDFSNLIGTHVDFSIPDVELVFVSKDQQKSYLQDNVYMLTLYTNFLLSEAHVEGVIVIALGVHSLNLLIDKINEILESYNE